VAKNVILLGEVAARGAAMLDIPCGRCDRHGRLSVQRLLPTLSQLFGAPKPR